MLISTDDEALVEFPVYNPLGFNMGVRLTVREWGALLLVWVPSVLVVSVTCFTAWAFLGHTLFWVTAWAMAEVAALLGSVVILGRLRPHLSKDQPLSYLLRLIRVEAHAPRPLDDTAIVVTSALSPELFTDRLLTQQRTLRFATETFDTTRSNA